MGFCNYLLFGLLQGKSPNRYFDPKKYTLDLNLTHIPQFCAIFHYLYFSKGSRPLTSWDRSYLETYPYVKFFSRSPLVHLYRHNMVDDFSQFKLVSKKLLAVNFAKQISRKIQKDIHVNLSSCGSIKPLNSFGLRTDSALKLVKIEANELLPCMCVEQDQISCVVDVDSTKENAILIKVESHSEIVFDAILLDSIFVDWDSGLSREIYENRLIQYFSRINRLTNNRYLIDNADNFTLNKTDLLWPNDSMPETLQFINRERKNIDSISKILLVSHEDSHSGAPLYLAQLASQLQEDGYEVFCIVIKDDSDAGVFSDCNIPFSRLIDLGLPTEKPKWTNNHWLLNTWGEQIFNSFLSEFSPDLILINSLASSDVLRLTVRRNFRTILYVHESWSFQNYLHALADPFEIAVVNALLGADLVLFGSTSTAQHWMSQISEINGYVLPTYRKIPGSSNVHIKSEDGMARSKFGLDDHHKVVLSVAHFEPRKRIEDIIQAFSMIDDPNLRLILVGAPKIEDTYIHDLNRLIDDYRIIKVPSLEFPALLEIYLMSDVLVFASQEETYPLVLQEAAALGVPRIISKFPGYSEIGTDGEDCLSFEIGDVATISELILKVLYDSELAKKITKNARVLYEEGLRKNAKELPIVFTKVLAPSISIIDSKWLT